jgi:hypothetical protein
MNITSQVSGNSRSIDQKSLMDTLDQMAEQGMRLKETDIKRKKNGSGYLDTQLFPEWWEKHPMKAEAKKAVPKIKAVFQHNTWSVNDGVDEVSLRLEDLFPSKEYDISETKSREFGKALALRLTMGNLNEEANKLVSENKQGFYEISISDVGEIDESKVLQIVCNAIPLNDYQKNIRDSVEIAASRETLGE